MTDKEHIQNLEEENQLLRRQLLTLMQRDVLLHLLRGSYPSVEFISDQLSRLDIELRGPSYMLLFYRISVHRRKGVFLHNQLVDQSEIMLRELFSPVFPCVTAHIEMGSVAILSIDDEKWKNRSPSDGLIPTVNSLCEDFWRSLESELGCTAVIFSSRPQTGLEGLTTAFREVRQIFKYRQLMGTTGPILHYYIFQQKSDADAVSFRLVQMEKYYITCIEKEDYEQARQVMRQLIQEEFPQLQALQTSVMAKINLLRSTVGMYIGEAGLAKLDGFYPGLSWPDEAGSTIDFLMGLVDKTFELVSHYKAEERNKRQPSWMSMLLTYVDMNYRDSSLSVASVSEHFGMNPTHVSREVKLSTGLALFDYIQENRVTWAVQEINRGRKLKTAAASAGFSNIKAMRTAVLKRRGALPSKLSYTYGGLDATP